MPEAPSRVAAVIWSVVVTACVAVAVIVWGPEPLPSPSLFGPTEGFLEPRDRLWYLVWLGLPPLLLLLARGLPARLTAHPGWLWTGGTFLAGSAFVLVSRSEPGAWTLYWHFFGWRNIVAGLAGAWGLAWLSRRRRGAWLLGGLGVAGLGRAACYLHISPAAVPDPFHLAYVLDDLLAFSAGRVPLVDTSPIYTALLGAPLAPLIRGLGWDPVAAATGYLWALLLLMQLTVAAALIKLLGWRHAWLAVLVVACVPLMGNRLAPVPMPAVGTYLPVWPVRLLVPALSLAALVGWRTSASRPLAGAGALGMLGALGVLCNVDFGSVNLVALAGLLGVLAWRDRSPAPVAAFGAAAGLTWLGYAALVWGACGQWPSPGRLFEFGRSFAQAGFWAVPIPEWGLALPAASLAVLCLWLAVLGLAAGERDPRVEVLAYAAAFALGSLAYYVGRSVTVMLPTGCGLSLGIVAAIWTALRLDRPAWPCSLGPGLAWVPLRLGAWLPAATLVAVLAWQPTVWRLPTTTAYPLHLPPSLPATERAGAVLFTVDHHLRVLQTGATARGAYPPVALNLPAWADAYCEDLGEQGLGTLWVEPDEQIWKRLTQLSTRPACQARGITPERLDAVPPGVRARSWVRLPLGRGGSPEASPEAR